MSESVFKIVSKALREMENGLVSNGAILRANGSLSVQRPYLSIFISIEELHLSSIRGIGSWNIVDEDRIIN